MPLESQPPVVSGDAHASAVLAPPQHEQQHNEDADSASESGGALPTSNDVAAPAAPALNSAPADVARLAASSASSEVVRLVDAPSLPQLSLPTERREMTAAAAIALESQLPLPADGSGAPPLVTLSAARGVCVVSALAVAVSARDGAAGTGVTTADDAALEASLVLAPSPPIMDVPLLVLLSVRVRSPVAPTPAAAPPLAALVAAAPAGADLVSAWNAEASCRWWWLRPHEH